TSSGRSRAASPARPCCSSCTGTAPTSTSPWRPEGSSAMWKSELASVCRRHRDLVAIYEAPEGTLALLLRQTLVPLSEERGRWFNDTRRTARAVVARLRPAGVTEA